jgi:hypothetical protein
MKTTNSPLKNSMSHSLPRITSLPRRNFSEGGSLITNHYSFLTILPLALCYLALCSALEAVTPAPDGAYPGGNTAEGQNALQSLTSGINNTALGFQALYDDTTGSNNAATGLRALYSNTTGVNNTATGSQALLNNTTGGQNTANGYVALSSNTSGVSNTATGSGALHSNTSASQNTATGYIALYRNTTGTQNTATGDRALYSNTTGGSNTATGYQALDSNTTGPFNTAMGSGALSSNTTGGRNTAMGDGALLANSTGASNTAVGVSALRNNTTAAFNTAVGHDALGNNNTGFGNIALGFSAGNFITTASHVICIGNVGANVSDSCYIGQIFGATSSGGTAVFINSDGKLGTATSSRRFKDDIQPMERASEALFALKPVTFRYKTGIDPQGIPQFGLVAEDVEAVNPDLVVRDKDGKVNTVRYDAVNAMLLNEFLKEHRKVEQLTQDFEATVVQQQNEIQALTAQLKEQASQIQKVSAQLAAYTFTRLTVRKPASQTVFNNQ